MGEPSSLIKHEPPVEFVLILSRPTGNWPQKDVKPTWWVKSVTFAKFDAKWPSKSSLFQIFFTCLHCQLVVKFPRHLAAHLKACRKINPARFECDFCGKRFQKKSSMRRHMMVKHSSEKENICSKCGHGFSSKLKLLQHLRSKKMNRCAVCDVEFSCRLLLYRHRSELHGVDDVCKCTECPYKTKKFSNFMRHKASHNKSLACETCQRSFTDKYVLRDHQTQHRHGIYESNPEVTFDCSDCDKTFMSRKTLIAHKEGVHDTKQVKCKVCCKIFRNSYLLRLHGRVHTKVECSICHNKISKFVLAAHLRTHSAESPFKCDLCDRSAKGKIHIKKHIERAHLLPRLLNDSKCRNDFRDFELLDKLQLWYGSWATISEKKFKCDKCNTFFITPKRMKEHNRTVHSEKTFECETCKKAFKTNSDLTKHKKGIHPKVSCSICQKKIGKRLMKSHMKIHQDKDFECDLCNYKTQFKQNLELHVKRRHRKGALTCNFGCHKKFSNFHQLFDHQKIHIGWKQWKCRKCDFRTVNKQDLFKHMSAKKHKSLVQ